MDNMYSKNTSVVDFTNILREFFVQKFCAQLFGTVKLGYNELGYNENPVITNKNSPKDHKLTILAQYFEYNVEKMITQQFFCLKVLIVAYFN